MDNESSVQTTATFFDPVDLQMDFPLMERNLVNRWYEQGIVEKYLHKNDASDKYFSFQDGPITANNPMGVHHAWGRTYKDLWQRYKNMQGYKERFQNGFDCQGLWVEVEVEKELGLHNKKDIENLVPGDKQASIAKFIELCRARVMKFSGIQTEQTKRLGNFMDWENSYFTMSSENNYMIWHFLKKCFDRGLIYKGHDSVPWCPRCGTAISQHEMLTEDYKDAVHESVFFALPVTNEDYSLLVWTTTPWTVPANVAVAVHPDWTYAIWKNEETNQSFVILDKGDWEGEANPSERVFTFVKGNMTKVREIQGSELLGKKYTGPYDGLDAVVAAREAKPDT
ncbi:class I tRNA ligase family protein, partial [Candidatus Woesebacteria bacterium]|nr:class I tRNA ligase family protein [Candidatus Woesebacteria bacterium]